MYDFLSLLDEMHLVHTDVSLITIKGRVNKGDIEVE